MKINESLGVIHDAFFYCVAYFNRKTVVEYPSDNGIPEQIYFTNYDNLKTSKNALDPPEILYPLFYYDGKRSSVITAYFDQYIDLFYNTIDDF